MLTVLSHDLVLRRNHRVDLDSGSPTAFALSTYGSHHIRLVDRIAYLWNTIRQNTTHAHLFIGLQDTPRFRTVDSGESFGIVRSQFVEGYQYLVDVKEEEPDNLLDLSAQPADVAQQPLRSMNIDPALLSQPLVSSLAPIDGSASTFPSVRHTLGKGKVSVRHTLATIICVCFDLLACRICRLARILQKEEWKTRLGTARSWRRVCRVPHRLPFLQVSITHAHDFWTQAYTHRRSIRHPRGRPLCTSDLTGGFASQTHAFR